MKSLLSGKNKAGSGFSGTNPARSVLLLFNGTNPQDVAYFREIHKTLEQTGIRPKMMAFVDSKVDVHDFGMALYNGTSIKWNFTPKPKLIELVRNRDFDILFNLNPQQLPHLHFLAVASNARFKVSTLTDLPNDFNLCVKTKQDLSLPKLFEQMKGCLETLSV